MKVTSLETEYFWKMNRNGMGVQMWGKDGQSRVLACHGKV